jgi:hypothetical protein
MKTVISKKQIRETIQKSLLEKRNKTKKVVLLDGGEVEFGCPEHLGELKNTLIGLEKLRDCFNTGSGTRMIFANACSKIRKIIEQFTKEES